MKQKLEHLLPNQHRLSGSNKELEERCTFFHWHHPTPSIKKQKKSKGDDEDPHRLIVPLLASLVILASYLAFSRLAFLIC